MDYENENCSFLECAIAILYVFFTIGGFVLMFWFLSWFLKPDNYVPSEKSKVKIEQIKSTKPVIKHDITVETNVVVSDGVTRRTMKSKIVADTITHNMIRTVNSNMLNATYHMVDTRQKEVDPDSKYWSRNVIPINREK